LNSPEIDEAIRSESKKRLGSKATGRRNADPFIAGLKIAGFFKGEQANATGQICSVVLNRVYRLPQPAL
jgi:hypothetical protein